MARTIKFRAWDNERLEMVYDIPVIILCDRTLWPHDLGYFHNSQQWTPDEGLITDFELMQFTGLLDKNGKEIYEGDICQAMQGEQQKPESFYVVKSRVTFWKGSFEFFGKPLSDVNTYDNNAARNIMWCWHGAHGSSDIYEEINSIEVIGNVFENSDLLK